MSPDEGTDEYEEVQHEVEKAEAADDLESGENPENQQQRQQKSPSVSKQKCPIAQMTSIIRRYVSPIFIQAFNMTFLAVSIS
jgi:hypothetical protein